jgi:antitoxin FitA
MTQLLIRNVKTETIRRLKRQAKQHHRSLQGELQFIVETAASTMTQEEMKAISQGWQKRLKSHSFTDSAAMLREDRSR